MDVRLLGVRRRGTLGLSPTCAYLVSAMVVRLLGVRHGRALAWCSPSACTCLMSAIEARSLGVCHCSRLSLRDTSRVLRNVRH